LTLFISITKGTDKKCYVINDKFEEVLNHILVDFEIQSENQVSSSAGTGEIDGS